MVLDLVVALRPRQWTKNLLVFAGLLFSQGFHQPALVARAAAAFVLFCLLSGATYLINDVLDMARDRSHPRKRHRPIASGRIPRGLALTVGAVLLVGAVLAAFTVSTGLGVVALAYAVLLTAYSAGLKHVVILDALLIAAGFVLRALAGVVVLDVEFSHWLMLCTILLALFLTFGKRRHELLALEGGTAAEHRPILSEYSPQLLDQMISVVTASTLMAYALYTVAPETQAKLGPWLPLTIPFVLYGIFRYLYLLYRRDLGGDPSEHLLTDGALLVTVALWGVAVVAGLYLGH